jgi:hypothetical protein
MRPPPAVDAAAAGNGEAEGEAEAQEVVIVWGDGSKATG